jgi:surfactin synthase thioesterase subunit
VSAWWPAPEPRPHAPVRLFCLPYAGGRASMFRSWPAGLPASVEVRALALPGRERRHVEAPLDDLETVITKTADALEPLLDRPWALFGHSMGAILGFELACALRRRGAPAPLLLVVAGHDAPQFVIGGGEIHLLPDAALADELRRLAGTPPEVLADPEVMALLLPSLRADFRICETYVASSGEPLDVPLLVLDALGDDETTAAGIAGWARHTTAAVTHVTLPGNHFFVHHAERALLQAITRELQALELTA